MNRKWVYLLAAVVGLVGVSGCGSSALLQIETTIRPDGSCERAIWQPKDEMLVEGALGPDWRARWRTVEDVDAPPAFAREAGSRRPDPDHAYFHAEGSFSSPAEIPAHFLKRIDDHPEAGSSELVRSYDRVDYGLIVAHRWRESITNIVTREDFQKARDQFIEIGVPMLRQALDEVFGREYDVSALSEEIQRRAEPLLADLLDIYFDMAATPGADPDALRPLLAAALRRAGVEIPEGAEKTAAPTLINELARAHLKALILRDVKRRDGQPMTEADVQAILNDPSQPKFQDAWKKYGDTHKAEIDAKLAPLVIRMTGLYGYPPIFSGPGPRFVFGIRLPGWIVDTNGTSVEPGHIVWNFRGKDLYPGGFEMRAESLDIDREAQTRLLGRVVIDDVNSARTLRDLLAQDDDLADLLRGAAEKGDPAVLRDFPFPMKNETRRARLDDVKKLLELAE